MSTFVVLIKFYVEHAFLNKQLDYDFARGYYEDKEGNRTYISRKVESKYIEYLSSYEEFSEKDRKVFNKMKSDN